MHLAFCCTGREIRAGVEDEDAFMAVAAERAPMIRFPCCESGPAHD